jgi:hypothetical protein
MNLKNLTIELNVHDIQEIIRIDLDGDGCEALRFVRETLAKKVKDSLQPH